MHLFKQFFKTFSATVLLAVLFIQIGVMTPRFVAAQGVVSDPGTQALLVQEGVEETADEVRDQTQKSIFGSIVGGVITALINVMSSYTQGLAEDAAIAIATGDNGGKPLLEQRPIEDYALYAGASVAADIIEGLNQSSVVDGRLERFNVCAPPSLGSIRAGIAYQYQEIAYQYQEQDLEICGDLDTLRSNWGGFFETVRDNIQDPQTQNETILNTVSNTIDPGVGGFSASLSVFSTTLFEANQRAQLEIDKLNADDGFYDVTNFITGNIETPSDFVVSDYEAKQQEYTVAPLRIGSGLVANSDALIQVGLNAASVFTSTLLNQYSKKLTEGLFDSLTLDDNPFDEFSPGTANRDSVVQALRSIATFQPLDSTNYNLLSEMASCPNSLRGTTRKIYNCVIDTNFATVIARANGGIALTLEDAIDEGLINGGWRLIPETDTAANQDPNCYTYGFCHSNLVKLRKARIIPIGWELATTLPEAASGSLTLNDVMNGFNDCNEENERDDAHPFCHLIDPNWVLKMPEASCRILANGQLLEASGISSRAEECVDIQSCIAEDENGVCVGGYGYCVREKNIWRFRGDECPANAASCLSFTSRVGESANYLTSSVDQANCNEGNAGCLWYATQKDQNAEGEFDWPVIVDVAAADADPDAYKSRVYFNGNVETCGEGEAGCTALIEKTDQTVLNLVQNASFETAQSGFAEGWLSTNYVSSEYDTSRLQARSGSSAVNPGVATIYQPSITLNSGSFYTLSFYAKQAVAGGAATAQVALILTDRNGNEANLNNTSFDTDACTLLDLDGSGVNETIAIQVTPGSDYQRYDCLFTMPTFANGATVGTAVLDLSGIGFAPTDVWFDDVMVENSTNTSNFTEDYNYEFTSLAQTHLKLPPSYLNCDGSLDQPEECGDYAQICIENDAGCMEYTPANGDPTVNGIVSELDQCSSECVGYDTYKQEPTLYEPAGEFPVFFIPDSAEQCTQEAVGCDEFTNLDTEEQEYFTYLRACVSDAQAAGQGATFYTWEGSDTEGYQLRTWNLVESNITSLSSHTYASGFTEVQLGDAPCTKWQADENGIVCAESISDVTIPAPNDCDEHSDIFDNPDCREFYDDNGNVHYRNWRETVTVGDACSSFRKTTVAGLGDDTDANGVDDGEENCVASGGYFNTAANTCIYYGSSEESEGCSADENGCREYTGGQSGNSRVVLDDNFESGLTAWSASSAANVDLSSDSIATGGNSLKASNGATIETFSYDFGTTCSTAGGCASGTETLGGNCTVVEGERYCGTLQDQLFQGKTYTLTFWAKGNGAIDVGFDIPSGGAAFFGENVELEPDWKRYSFGPLNMTEAEYPGFSDGTVLKFVSAGASEYFLDNIVLREGESNITVIRDSWVTPATCDENFEGVISPQFQLGCQEYADQLGTAHYLKSFSRLCSEDVVGCQAYYHTANSDNVGAVIRNATCSSIDGLPVSSKTTCYLLQSGGSYDINSPAVCDIPPGESSCRFDLNFDYPDHLIGTGSVAHVSYGADAERVGHDRTIYAVYASEFACSASAEACKEVGVPEFSADGSVVSAWESTYLVNDPDQYDDILCEGEDLFCEEWNGSDNSTWYFKHPQNRLCEYKTNVTVSGVQLSGWFRKGTTDLCYGTGTCSNTGTSCSLDSECATTADPNAVCNINDGSYIIAGAESGLWKTGDVDYDGWVGTCDGSDDGCSEFQDPLDVGEDQYYGEADGEQYFFVDNENLDDNSFITGTKCDGQVSQREGCVLFNDTGDTGLDYSASASLMASRNADVLFGGQPFDLVDPINCESGDSTITTRTGQTVDLCANRCVYKKQNLYSSFNDATAVVNSTLDYYEIDGSCYVDTDCGTREADTGDILSGRCRSTVVDPNGVLADVAVPRLQNDTNRVLSVNRDRVCSEWLEPSGERPVWDASIGRYRNVSSAIELCEAYLEDGDTTVCADLVTNDPVTVLNVDRYTSRDVTWYGEEYVGYAIPDTYPVQHLSQVNIANNEKVCFNQATGEYTDTVCSTTQDCPSTTFYTCERPPDDYRLAYNAGECSEAHGSSCTVGYCSGSALPCTGTNQCLPDGGECIVGQCVDAAGEQTGEACGLDYACSTGTCNVSVSTISGTCYANQCVVSPQGTAFDASFAESQICRAYPEDDSPFTDELVDTWIDGDGSSNVSSPSNYYGYSPYQTLSGFENANFCAPGEDCVCSYRKITAQSNGPIYLNDEVESITNLGICIGGQAAGSPCRTNVATDCGGELNNDGYLDNGAECRPVDHVDTLYGLPGFCLERDTGINIQGNQDLGACITWLPIDELQGTTDLYAKFLEAGYFEEEYMCGEVQVYANIHTTLGCSEIRGLSGTGSAPPDSTTNNQYECGMTIACPDGWFAVAGASKANSGETSTEAEACTAGVNGCPYRCVPPNSVHTEDIANSDLGDLCEPPTSGYNDAQSGTSVYGTRYYIASNDDTDALLERYEDCTYYGSRTDGTDQFSVMEDFPGSLNSNPGFFSDPLDKNEYSLTEYWDIYPACENLIEVSAADGGYAYTDRLLHPDPFPNEHEIQVGNDTYVHSTDTSPFGASVTPNEVLAGNADGIEDPTPAVLGACAATDGYTFLRPESLDPTDCPINTTFGFGEDPPEARPYIDWLSSIGGGFPNVETNESYGDIIARLQTLFAKPLNLVTWDSEQEKWGDDETLGEYGDPEELESGDNLYWDVRGTVGEPPTVAAIDADNCFNSRCEEGPTDAITVNGQNSGDILSEGDFFRATVDFFAYANKDQLPIRRVIVDWQDNPFKSHQSGSSNPDNYYKNHRGLLQNDPGRSWCDTNNEWGMTEESCDDSAFHYTNAYICTPSMLIESNEYPLCETDVDGNLVQSPCIAEVNGRRSCAFQPRVHVRDNWGWCTGVCTAGGDSTLGCFEGSTDTLTEPNSGLAGTECAYQTYPDGQVPNDPWVYYDGVIYVTP